ncbi:TPA: sodium:proton antiporter, partial [Enterococcus faecium]|nr:sodium:proton antiporter [Enterococcus faecium]
KLEGIKMNSGNLISSWMIQQDSLFTKKMLRGYYLERKIIDEYEVAEKITTFSANSYRRNINLLESYTMNKPSDNFSFRFAFRAKSKKTSPIK